MIRPVGTLDPGALGEFGLIEAIRREPMMGTLIGFGSFLVRHREARKGRNPKTGEVIMIAPTKTVAFKPAPNFKASL